MSGPGTFLIPLAALILPVAIWPLLRQGPVPAVWLGLADALVLVALSMVPVPAPAVLPTAGDTYFIGGSARYLRQLSALAVLWALLALPVALWFPWRARNVALALFAVAHFALVSLALPRLLFRFGDRSGAPSLAQLELVALQLGTLVLPATAVLSLVSLGWMLFRKVRSRAL